MVGRDINSSPTQYRTWVVDDEPDLEGFLYTGLKSGTDPLVDITAYDIEDGYAIVDFNLPSPLQWNTTFKTLPLGLYDSQLAIIGEFAYLFGGNRNSPNLDGYGTTGQILRANINNPADWEDTGAILPFALSSSQLAVVNNRVYLFGGFNGGAAVDHIFSAPLSDPLSWVDHGSKLPTILYSSQLGMFDGYLYLFGGYKDNDPTDIIYRASVTDPLTWVNTGFTLPEPLFASTIGIMGDNVYLFGGIKLNRTSTSNIYQASLTNATSWTTNLGVLPHNVCNGQFFTIASKGYLVGASSGTVTGTKILRCEIANPIQWVDTQRTLPGAVTHSQFGIIDDRLFFFGGDGSSIIFADQPTIKYLFNSTTAINYGLVTRTYYNATIDKNDLFALLGFPYWRTNYGA